MFFKKSLGGLGLTSVRRIIEYLYTHTIEIPLEMPRVYNKLSGDAQFECTIASINVLFVYVQI